MEKWTLLKVVLWIVLLLNNAAQDPQVEASRKKLDGGLLQQSSQDRSATGLEGVEETASATEEKDESLPPPPRDYDDCIDQITEDDCFKRKKGWTDKLGRASRTHFHCRWRGGKCEKECNLGCGKELPGGGFKMKGKQKTKLEDVQCAWCTTHSFAEEDFDKSCKALKMPIHFGAAKNAYVHGFKLKPITMVDEEKVDDKRIIHCCWINSRKDNECKEQRDKAKAAAENNNAENDVNANVDDNAENNNDDDAENDNDNANNAGNDEDDDDDDNADNDDDP